MTRPSLVPPQHAGNNPQDNKGHPPWLFALLAGAIFAALCAGSWGSFTGVTGMETGDVAVNALAISEAKQFARIHGNYSRWGFFHPGPAFLYVQAAGEWLLVDALGVVSTPAAAHHISIIALNSVLLVVAISFWPGGAREAWFPPVAVTLMIAHAALINRELPAACMLSTWPPQVLFSPFACFLVASAAWAAGNWRGLPWCVFAGGLLAHGHAAHGLFVGPVFLFAAARHLWLVRRGVFAWRPPPVALWSSMILLVVFLTPLVADVLHGEGSNLLNIWRQLHTPNPYVRRWSKAVICFFSYFAYIGNQREIIDELSAATESEFLRRWPALTAWAAVHVWLITITVRSWRRRDSTDTVRFERELVCVLALSAILTVIWMKVQMGRLENFNSFFAYSLPLVGGWLFLGQVLRRLPAAPKLLSTLAWIIPIATGFATRSQFHRHLVGDNGVASAFEEIQNQRTEETAGVLLTFEPDAWPRASALLLQAARGGIPVKAAPEWDFMFGPRRIVDPFAATPSVWFFEQLPAGSGMVSVEPGDRVRFEPESLTLGPNPIPLSKAGLLPFLVYGISYPSSWHEEDTDVSTVGNVARLQFRLPVEATGVTVHLDVEPGYVRGKQGEERFGVSWNDRKLFGGALTQRQVLRLEIPVTARDVNEVHELRLDSPDAISPRTEGVSSDFRLIGIRIYGLSIDVW